MIKQSKTLYSNYIDELIEVDSKTQKTNLKLLKGNAERGVN